METGAKPAPELIDAKTAAAIAGVSAAHIYRLVHRGAIEALRVGDGTGPIRIPKEPFEEWLRGPGDGGP